jgi:hypothetical protein
MAELMIPGTKRTPLVMMDFKSGLIEIRGNSIPEDPSEFFRKLERAIEEYRKNPAPSTTANIFLNIFNTSTSKWMVYLLLRLKEFAQTDGQNVIINWLYERGDEDSLEAGRGFMKLLKYPVNLIETEPED